MELVKEPTGRFLRFFVDTDEGVSVDELEISIAAYCRGWSAWDYDYMEVSSPGAGPSLKDRA